VDTGSDHSEAIAERVRAAAASATPLAIRGGGSRAFYGHPVAGEALEVADHRGVLHYAPTELMLTARAGTPLASVEALLAEHGQMLAFEPPRHGRGTTLGGAVATGLSGPGRPFAGAVRDHVLGVRIVDGRGAVGRFGGEVIKNVAGYDVSRLMAGALGTLGVILDVSLKVLPRPETEQTVALEQSVAAMSDRVERALRAGAPVTGAAHDGERARIRLSGAASAVAAGARALGGEGADDAHFWARLRDHDMPLFAEADTEPLWRLSLAPASQPAAIPGRTIVDWAGQLHWIRTGEPPQRLRRVAEEAGGHATLFRGGERATPVFTPLEPALARVHRRLKQAFDPVGVLNPGRMYPDL